MSPQMRNAVMFFANNAGYSAPPGRMVCAKTLAEAESLARELGLEVTWEYDDDADYSWCTPKDLEQVKSGSVEVLCASVKSECGEILASLGGIFIHVDDRDYRRVVAAELFAESIEALKRAE